MKEKGFFVNASPTCHGRGKTHFAVAVAEACFVYSEAETLFLRFPLFELLAAGRFWAASEDQLKS